MTGRLDVKFPSASTGRRLGSGDTDLGGFVIATRCWAAACFDWPGGYVAHHYVRYMGDMSGGQVIRRIVERTYDLTDHAGTGFYVFDEVGDLKAFKARYRDLLDSVPWSSEERDRVVEEILVAYRLNTGVLDGLGRPG